MGTAGQAGGQEWILRMEIKVECDAIRSSECDGPRLIFTGPVWSEWDITFCIHGVKLRWNCEWCDEYFAHQPGIEKEEK